jgi:hypothetical protein
LPANDREFISIILAVPDHLLNRLQIGLPHPDALVVATILVRILQVINRFLETRGLCFAELAFTRLGINAAPVAGTCYAALFWAVLDIAKMLLLMFPSARIQGCTFAHFEKAVVKRSVEYASALDTILAEYASPSEHQSYVFFCFITYIFAEHKVPQPNPTDPN